MAMGIINVIGWSQSIVGLRSMTTTHTSAAEITDINAFSMKTNDVSVVSATDVAIGHQCGPNLKNWLYFHNF